MKDFGHACLPPALLACASSACAVTAPVQPIARCQIVEGQKLPAASGGVDALCAAIDRAAAVRGVEPGFTVNVRVGPRSMLAAVVTLADGSTLPAVNMAEMDRAVTRSTLDRFGEAVADHIKGAAR